MTFACPHCAQKLEVGDKFVGQTMNCPACEQSIVVPQPSAPVRGAQATAPRGRPQAPPRAPVSRLGSTSGSRAPATPSSGGKAVVWLALLAIIAGGAYFYR